MIVEVQSVKECLQLLHLSRQKVVSEGSVQRDTSRLFHACKVETGNAQSLKLQVDRSKTMSDVVLEEQ